MYYPFGLTLSFAKKSKTLAW